jgi:glycosyltransferase involved in cell wall biosynthesis
MAAGGIAFTGGTGEDYALPYHNAIVLETSDPREIESNLVYLREFPDEDARIRAEAQRTATYFTWEAAAENLISKLEDQACVQEALTKNISVLCKALDDAAEKKLQTVGGGLN